MLHYSSSPILHFTDEDSEAARFTNFFKVTQLGHQPGYDDQCTAFSLYKFFPSVSDFCITSTIYTTSGTPICHKVIIFLNAD